MEAKPETKYVPWLSGALAVTGALGFIIAGASPLGWISALIMATGAAFLLAWWLFGGKATGRHDLDAEKTRLGQRQQKLEETREVIKGLLKDLPFADQRLESPDSAILVDIERLRDLLDRIDNSRRKMDAVNQRMEHHEEIVNRLFRSCSMDHGSRDILERIDILQMALQEAEQRCQNAKAAKAQTEELQSQLKDLDDRIIKLKNEKDFVISRINTLPGEDLTDRAEKLMEARDLAYQARSIMEELKREYPDLEDIKRDLEELSRKNELNIDDMALAKAKAERDQIEHELNSLNSEIGTLKKAIELGMEEVRLDEVRGEIAAYEDEYLRVSRQRIA